MPQPIPQPRLTPRYPASPGPPAPTLFERRWPKRSASAPSAVLIAAAVVAVVAAIVLPGDRAGIGWPVAGLALSAALLTLRIRQAPGVRQSVEAFAWSIATVLLLSVGAVRDAGWLFLLCVCTAFGCLALSVSSTRRIPAVALAVLNLPLAGFRALPWVRWGLVRVRADRGSTGALRVLASVALGLVLLVVFGALFASADAVFDGIVEAITPKLSVSTPFRWLFVGAVFAWLTIGGAYLLFNPSSIGDAGPREVRAVRWYEWVIPVGAVLTVFGLFVGLQLTVLFGDQAYVIRTAHLTFAEYARKGFWQLLVVTLLTLLVIAVTVRMAPRETRRDRQLLRLLLGALALGALVVVASAVYRMKVYEEAYGFTRLRLLISAVELWLGGLFVLVVVAGLARSTRWLPRVAVALWVVTLLGLAVLNPDLFIAEQNLAHHGTATVDVRYLATLSADAVPAFDKLSGEDRDCARYGTTSALFNDPDDWRGWNLSRWRALQRVPTRIYPPWRDPNCL